MHKSLTRRGALALAGLAAAGAALGTVGCDTGAGTDAAEGAASTLAGIEPVGDTTGWDTTYYPGAYASAEEARAAGEQVAEQVEAGGIVLLANDGTLPLAPGTAVSLLGRGAVDVVYGGTGAALVDTSRAVSLRQACEDAGLAVNATAWDWLSSVAANYPRATVGALDKPETVSHYLGEVPWSTYPEEVRASLAGTVGVVVLSRPSGEGADLSQDLLASLESGVSETFLPNAETERYEPGQHQLELCAEERELLAAARQACDALVVLLNVATTMEVGPLVEPGGELEADALLEVGFPGTVGLRSVARVLTGELNPSGRTCDLWAADLAATPSFANFGNHTYPDVTDYYTSIGSGAHYVEYEEGIYVGYRYYETAAAEAAAGTYPGFDYDSAVTFPFGFGLSYTSFTRELLGVSLDGEKGLATVRVTNTGDVAGRDVVQLYGTAPRTEGVEKSAVVLLAFAKTEELALGASQDVELSFSTRQLASWHSDRGAWVLDAGTYEVSLRTDSHTPVGTWQTDLAETTFDTDSATGAPVANRFDDVTAYVEQHCTPLSRFDFAGTFPERSEDRTAASVGVVLEEYDAMAHVNPDDEMPTTRADNGLALIDLRGLPYDDPLWEPLLDQLHPNVMNLILNNHSYGSDSVPSVGKPATREGDGPAGVAVYVSDAGHCGYPSEYLVAQSWDADLVRSMGEAIGDELLVAGLSGWCAPAMNCHRSPFGGRTFEYYSEDPLLAGTLAAAAVEGAFTRGIYAQMKHFVLNDQDTNRCAHLLTWASEQAIREIYARPFEIVVKTARGSVPYLDASTGERAEREVSAAKAVMSSYNYVGATWAGGCHALCTELLRDEWGFDGYVISDWSLYDYTDKNQAFYAGTDVNFTSIATTGEMADAESATAVRAMRQAMHRYLYAIANSNAMNGQAPAMRGVYQ
ncbi:glycoside hydrolase family 3 C-terminal domain-containing protein [Olsenella profusa]|uniref:Glycoside hydrolase family 3 C-terminal domain-containing protein n=1 Tax=Olsenella profusa TaxID=138595 RepID=A0ABS2F140_9ACTN|nr:glycoside hydrolase family 3 N-terminal domain-containing protein [Olsenella profusa]MBM6774308.1 glycoside hydrolase family 3 C-terminal domain-containing protein [Olsenella profusa]